MSSSASTEVTPALPPAIRVERLKPFGVVLQATAALPLTAVPPETLEELARTEKIVVLRGFQPPERDAFLAYCRTIPGQGLLEWDFGPVMEMREHPDAKNYLFSREAVPFHWDGAFHRVPSYLMFCCVEAPVEGAGGETLFCDTRKVFAEASTEDQDRMRRAQLTFETAKLSHYGGKITGDLVQKHPATGETILRFAEPVVTELNPVTLSIGGVAGDEQGPLLSWLTERVYAPENCYSHAWRSDDILVADNHTLIHGRRAFERDCPRHLRRIQVL